MNIDDVKRALSLGFEQATTFQRQALGIEMSNYKHSIVGIEYVATVKIAEQFFDAERVVHLEKHHKAIRDDIYQEKRKNIILRGPLKPFDLEARTIRQLEQESEIAKLNETKNNYSFGARDAQRIDIVVSDVVDPTNTRPKVAIEVKVYNGSFPRFRDDIERVAKLVQMCLDFDYAQADDFLGIATIYFQSVGTDAKSAVPKKFLSKTNNAIAEIGRRFPSVNFCLQEISQMEDPIQVDHYLDLEGNTEGEVLRDKMGYCALAVIASKK